MTENESKVVYRDSFPDNMRDAPEEELKELLGENVEIRDKYEEEPSEDVEESVERNESSGEETDSSSDSDSGGETEEETPAPVEESEEDSKPSDYDLQVMRADAAQAERNSARQKARELQQQNEEISKRLQELEEANKKLLDEYESPSERQERLAREEQQQREWQAQQAQQEQDYERFRAEALETLRLKEVNERVFAAETPEYTPFMEAVKSEIAMRAQREMGATPEQAQEIAERASVQVTLQAAAQGQDSVSAPFEHAKEAFPEVWERFKNQSPEQKVTRQRPTRQPPTLSSAGGGGTPADTKVSLDNFNERELGALAANPDKWRELLQKAGR